MITIICKICKCPKEIGDFYKSKNKCGHETSCKHCSNLKHYERRRERRLEQGLSIKFPTLASRQLMEEGKKYCPTCKQILNLSEFSTMKIRSGISSHCKECNKTWNENYYKTKKGKEKKQEVYKKQKSKYIERRLLKKYNITYKEYELILKCQNYKCAICGRTPEENKKMLAVDHNHKTGKNRGLLCSSCNICLGFIEKNTLDISTIGEYIIKHETEPTIKTLL